MFSVLTFGFKGSPGIFQSVGSEPLSQFHKGHTPDEPRWHSNLSMYSSTFVDDSALVTYDAGIGPALCESCFLAGLVGVFGLDALNADKDVKVGTWKQVQPYCGLTYNLVNCTVGMSTPVLTRASDAPSRPLWLR